MHREAPKVVAINSRFRRNLVHGLCKGTVHGTNMRPAVSRCSRWANRSESTKLVRLRLIVNEKPRRLDLFHHQSRKATFRMAFDWPSVFIRTRCQPCRVIVPWSAYRMQPSAISASAPGWQTISKNSPLRSAWTSSEMTPTLRLRRAGQSATFRRAPIRANLVSRRFVSMNVKTQLPLGRFAVLPRHSSLLTSSCRNRKCQRLF